MLEICSNSFSNGISSLSDFVNLQKWQSPAIDEIEQIEPIAPIRPRRWQNLALCLCFRYVLSLFAMFELIKPSIAILQFWQSPKIAISRNLLINKIELIAPIRPPLCENLTPCICFLLCCITF